MIEIEKFIDDKGLFDGKYLLLRQLSTAGGTADVWLAEDKDTEDERLSDDNDDEIIKVEGSAVLVAIKIYRPKNILDAEGIQTFKKEYKTVYNCHHANLLKPTGFSIIDDSVPYLVMPFCERGSIESQIGKITQTDELWKLIYDTASGLAYLHSCIPPIIHQDIKPANILIDSNNNYCITDFGISVKSGKYSEDYVDDENSGTIIYMPPERFKEGYEPSEKSDIWSLGATIYELVTGDVPFGDEGGVNQCNGRGVPEIKANIPKKIKSLIYSCLDANPDKRPTAEEIAEIARKKGKRYLILNLIVLSIIIAILGGLLIWNWTVTPEQASPFTILCNRGDSIVNIEKDNAKSDTPVEKLASRERLTEAIELYTKALEEQDFDASRKDSVINKVKAIQGLLPLYDKYKGICDSLDLANEYGADMRSKEYEEKQKHLSSQIKTNIINL